MPIIALTADISLSWDKLEEYGFNKYITKPINFNLIHDNIKEFINPGKAKKLNILVADDVETNHKVFNSQLSKT